MGRRKKGDKVNGWIILDKPLEMTSTQAVGKIRRIYNAQKAGHAGTLDPLATGILPIALGEATKTIPYIQDAEKTYLFEVTWGEQRSTDDAEGEVIDRSDKRPALEEIEKLLPVFTGDIEQTPPQFSAIKIDGQRAYDLARAGEEVEIKSRQVSIYSLDILECHSGESRNLVASKSTSSNQTPACAGVTACIFRITCSKGTYVRSLARDMGIKLGCFGYISSLRREAVGHFCEENAILLDKLEEISDKPALKDEYLQPVQTALDDILALPVTEKEAALLKNGQFLSFISKADFHRIEGLGIDLKTKTEALAIYDDTPIGIITIKGAEVRPVKIFNL